MSFSPQDKDDAGKLCIPSLINGRPVTLPSSASFPVTSSAEQRVVHYGQTATEEIAWKAVDAAYTTFKTYKSTSVHERRRLLLRVAEVAEAKAEEAAVRQIRETSCNRQWANFNAMQVSTFCREIAGAVSGAVVGEIQPSYFGYTSLVFKEPVGPVMVILPWNAAMVLSVRAIANALAAGCTVVFKASELCPWTHQFVAQLFHEAGFPPGAVNMIMADRPAGPKITEAVISHRHLRKIEFIGSANVGRMIGQTAAKYLKPVLMELGDQSPAIVLDDANLKRAADLIAKATMMHHGQICFGTERIIVQSSVREAFERELSSAMKSNSLETVAVTKASAEKAKSVIDEAIFNGARFIYGDSEMRSPASMGPSILTDVPKSSALSTAESFAPTAFLETVETEEEAIEEANSRLGGLSAAIHTESYERGIRVARELEFGIINVNNMTVFAERRSSLSRAGVLGFLSLTL